MPIQFGLFGRLKRLLEFPRLYGAFQQLVGGNGMSIFVTIHVRPQTAERVLDIGCGPAHILEQLPSVEYVGFDSSSEYIEAAQHRFGVRGRFFQTRIRDACVDQPGTFDLVLAVGVLHHLEDSEALDLFRLARQALKPGGRLITIDGCFEDKQAVLAKWLLRMDRGKFVRTRAGYTALASRIFPNITACVRHDLLRIPYTHLILECRSPAAGASTSPSAAGSPGLCGAES